MNKRLKHIMLAIFLLLNKSNKCFVITKKVTMRLEYKNLKEMTFIGYYTELKMNEVYEKCPEFWDKEYGEKYSKLFTTIIQKNDEEREQY